MAIKIQELDPKEVKFSPEEISARATGTKDKEIDAIRADIAESYVKRRENNQNHQIQPGIVRSKDNEFQVIDGNNRLAACLIANEALGKGEEKFLFQAMVVRDGDMDALVTAIQANEKRKASNIFDRAETMGRLLAMGKSQDEIASIYGLDKSTVSQTLAAGKLPATLRKHVLSGDVEPDAALLLATIPDTATRQELLEHCLAERNWFDEFEARLAEEKESENGNGTGKKGKKAEPEAEEEEDERPSKAKKAAKKKTGKSKVTKEAVARAAKQSDRSEVKRSAAAQSSSRIADKQFFAILEALYNDKDKPLPKPAKAVISAIEALKDGEIGTEAFRNRLLKNCLAE